MPAFDHGAATLHYDLEGPDGGFPGVADRPGRHALGERDLERDGVEPEGGARRHVPAHWHGPTQRRTFGRRRSGRSDEWSTMRDDQTRPARPPRCRTLSRRRHVHRGSVHRRAAAGGAGTVRVGRSCCNRSASSPMGATAPPSTRCSTPGSSSRPIGTPTSLTETWNAFRSNMWDGSFLLTASLEDDLATVETPLLVAMGNDVYHPESTSRTGCRARAARHLRRGLEGGRRARCVRHRRPRLPDRARHRMTPSPSRRRVFGAIALAVMASQRWAVPEMMTTTPLRRRPPTRWWPPRWLHRRPCHPISRAGSCGHWPIRRSRSQGWRRAAPMPPVSRVATDVGVDPRRPAHGAIRRRRPGAV